MKNGRPEFDYEPVTRGRRTPLNAREALVAEWPVPDEGLPSGEAVSDSVSAAPAVPSPGRVAAKKSSILKRGHLLSFIGLILFTLAMYLRVYILPTVQLPLILALLTLVAFIPSQLAAEGSLTGGVREVHLVLLLCLAGLLAVPFAYSPGDAFDGFWGLVKTAIIFIVLVNAVRTEWRLKVMFYLALGISAVLCVIALNDYHSGALTIEGYRVKGGIADGAFEDPNDLAAYLVAMLPIGVALGLSARGLLRKLVFGLYAVLSLGAIIVTFSRGGFLGLMAAALVLVWKLGRRHRLLAMGTASVAAVLFISLSPGNYWMRMASIFIPSLDPLGSASSRSMLLKQSVLVALRHPLFGIGMGNFMIISINEHVTHNAYTQVAAEMGLLALVVYILFTVTPIRRLRRIESQEFAARGRSRFYYLAVGLQASLIGYMVSSFFISVAYYAVIYYLVGYAVCLRRIYESTESKSEAAAAQALTDSALTASL
jgi:putative inorganic carbon (HCO3(-)) transporter